MRTTFVIALLAATTVEAQSPACMSVSVVGDATYCTVGAICSGTAVVPAGVSCPKLGDTASSDYVPSYVNGNCITPADAVCQLIPTGAWGCVWPSMPSTTTTAVPTSNGSISGSTPTVTPRTLLRRWMRKSLILPQPQTLPLLPLLKY
ncbi:Aste57867_854 [Aphanomyces stellatus]|uniref:Aste57867_854 protein n=1 Tax=Aphanomyces stellatus TaxID=120398 RepID=A0A485K3Z1_9STRA|nr:hypothetical protein As57867_000853 [Aphanomyces stellatus]VFT78078.1 Aste57867_854 [Aphanomyces stellatus]